MRYILSLLFFFALGAQAKVSTETTVNQDFYDRALLVLDALEEQSAPEKGESPFEDLAHEDYDDRADDIKMANRPLLMEGVRSRVCGRLGVHMDNILKRKNIGSYTKRMVLISDLATLAKCDTQ